MQKGLSLADGDSWLLDASTRSVKAGANRIYVNINGLHLQ